MSNPYREAADEIERTWHQRSNGIRPRRPLNNLWLGERNVPIGKPAPPLDVILETQVARANYLAARARFGRAVIALAATVVLLGSVIAAGWWVLSH